MKDMKKMMLEKNLGIQLLRICLAFWVVLQHCLSDKYQNRLEYFFSKIKLHVPCFILISFFFTCKTITGRNIFKIKQRFIRLLIPYTIYPIMLLIINNFLFFFFKINFLGRKISIISFRDLIVQFIIGRNILPVYWFQFFLIWTTSLFLIISFITKKKFLFVIAQIYIISYIILYSGINFNFFIHFNPNIAYSVGEIMEVMPSALSGLLIYSLNIMKIIKYNYKKAIYFSFMALYIIYNYNIFSSFKQICFGGIIIDICSILVFIIFYLIPFNTNKSEKCNNIIFNITNYTQGIYSLHLIIRKVLYSKVNIIRYGKLSGCFIIFGISYSLSFIGEKLTKKTKLVYLFL